MIEILKNQILKVPFLSHYADLIAVSLSWIGVIIVAFIANQITRKLIAGNMRRLSLKTKSKNDDILVANGVFERLSQLVPAMIIHHFAPIIFANYPDVAQFFITLSLIYMIFIGVLFLDALINGGHQIYRTYEVSKQFPIKSFTQIAKLILYVLGFIFTLSLLLGESPMTFFAGLGALAAVFMFVFKDPILGFVAGIQLTTNRMLSVGDWIEMPKYGVDGDIIEVALTTVKIRNFDKTITTIPTYSLIADSFKNWRGMQETGARRIKRSIAIDISSIKFCDEDMLQRFAKIQYIADYIQTKRDDVAKFNAEINADEDLEVNGRRLTNVGTFRAYIGAYLRNHPKISQDHTFLVRQLKPTEKGLPIEIYVFCNETNWILYEGIMADIFDHILAAAKEFDMRIFQHPTGSDFGRL